MHREHSIRTTALLVMAVALLAAACSTGSTDTTASSGSTDTTTDASSNDVSSAIIKEVQATLTALGYDTGSIDGIYGSHTTSAIEAFQKDAGITVDGKYGPETHTALEKAAKDANYDWSKHAVVEELQKEMAALGYYTGAVDGVYGPETESAIKAVQADCSLTQDGIYGPDTHACLVDLGGDA